MGDKTAIFDKDNADRYDFSLDYVDYNGQSCYLFTIKAKGASGVVIDEYDNLGSTVNQWRSLPVIMILVMMQVCMILMYTWKCR
jgi:hypothetical protein